MIRKQYFAAYAAEMSPEHKSALGTHNRMWLLYSAMVISGHGHMVKDTLIILENGQ